MAATVSAAPGCKLVKPCSQSMHIQESSGLARTIVRVIKVFCTVSQAPKAGRLWRRAARRACMVVSCQQATRESRRRCLWPSSPPSVRPSKLIPHKALNYWLFDYIELRKHIAYVGSNNSKYVHAPFCMGQNGSRKNCCESLRPNSTKKPSCLLTSPCFIDDLPLFICCPGHNIATWWHALCFLAVGDTSSFVRDIAEPSIHPLETWINASFPLDHVTLQPFVDS